MKVLHVVHWPRTGITSLLESLFEAFDTSAVKSYLFIVDAGAEDLAPFIGRVAGVGFGGSGFLNAVVEFAKMVRTIEPDIIHTHSFTPSLIAGVVAGRIDQVRTFHSEYPYFYSKKLSQRIKRHLEEWVLNRARTRIVCVSQGVERSLPYSFDNCVSQIIKNGLPLDKIVKQALLGESRERTWGADAGKTIIVSAGRLEHQKGFDILVKSIASIPPQMRASLLLVILGEGSQREELERIIAEHDLTASVKLLGYQSNPYAFITVADIYICSSRYEGYGLSLAEAMALGLPVATTKVSGVPEMIVDGETGILIDDLAPQPISQALMKLVDNKTLASRVAAAGQAFAKKEMDVKTVADEHVALYRGILHEQR